MVLPFVAMLGCIAVIPLLHGAKHWWESNLHRFYVAGGLALLTLLYYAVGHHCPIVGHFPAHHITSVPEGESIHFGTMGAVLANAMLNEYVPFIVLLMSLYTISGGIRIEGDLPAHPLTNCTFLAIGAAAGQPDRHDRRGDGADSAPVGNQSRAKARRAYRHHFHVHGLQLRRLLVAAGRSTAVS